MEVNGQLDAPVALSLG